MVVSLQVAGDSPADPVVPGSRERDASEGR
jgi:hypothetical protein